MYTTPKIAQTMFIMVFWGGGARIVGLDFYDRGLVVFLVRLVPFGDRPVPRFFPCAKDSCIHLSELQTHPNLHSPV